MYFTLTAEYKLISFVFVLINFVFPADCSELKLILEELGYECSTDEVLKVISKFDLNTTGTIDFNEFLSLIGDWMSNDENQIRDAFEVSAELSLD